MALSESGGQQSRGSDQSSYNRRRRTVPSPRDVVRNARLLLQSVSQHLIDDPALLAVQVSRRLPFTIRVCAGRALRAVGRRSLAVGARSFGVLMAGDFVRRQELRRGDPRILARVCAARSRCFRRFRSDRDPISTRSDARARAAWARGELSCAVGYLGLGGPRQVPLRTPCLRSELQLLALGSIGLPRRV